ncbi:flagellar biosynthesis anti-sigma factor FlgM [Geomonas sp. RF6]|uniref:flagellar biosynthesis anti-sigma factor FlgM n=1 Tax=Geomonas sp. RF6 TaxID=2897342 RepID=UPI001E3AD380|nr:flagellar biosynthesis anti-sigma factor FlgM [Geomonas sp. RF6]UFS68990.1 flagellar biosynthesis anti-sigma factor FlgM [Geomonas sp. RF6]
MKIEDSNQKMAVMHQMNNRAERPDATGAQAQSDLVVKPQPAGDKVELSGMVPSMSAEMVNQQAMRAQRVQEIKAQVQAGTYQVDSRAVAEKMLAKVGAGTTVH